MTALLPSLLLRLLMLLPHLRSVLLLRAPPRVLRVLLSRSRRRCSWLRWSAARSVKTSRLLRILTAGIIEVQPLPRLQLVERQRPG